MKFRLVELLQCPSHPQDVLKAVRTRLSEVFPYSGDLRIPFCRSACGLLGNWFSEIPIDLPPASRLNCRRCLGTEVEEADLTCPDCDYPIGVREGVLIPPTATPENPKPEESRLSLKTGQAISRLLSPRPGDLALIIAPLPETILDRWGCSGVERVQVDLQPEALISRRARSCANGHGLAHYVEGPLDLDIFRAGQFDQIVISLPSPRLTNRADNLAFVPALLRASGKAVLTFSREGSRAPVSERIKTYMENLPGLFETLKPKLTTVQGEDLLLLEHPEDRCILPQAAVGENSRQ